MNSAEPRCTGHCCRGFALEKSYATLLQDLRTWKTDPILVEDADIYMIAPMVIPLGEVTQDGKTEYLYTCKHLRPNGDCGIYEFRPQLCRDFPGEEPCPYPFCSGKGKKSLKYKLLDAIASLLFAIKVYRAKRR